MEKKCGIKFRKISPNGKVTLETDLHLIKMKIKTEINVN